MPDVPDSVIREASIAGAGAAERASKGVVERGRAKDRAFAEVIAGWAREQERQRIKHLLEARAREAALDYRRDPQAYHRGREDELEDLLAALDRDSAAAGKDGGDQ